MTPTSGAASKPVLVALTPEAHQAIGAPQIELAPLPFRVGRDSRQSRGPIARILMDRRRPASPRNNELYLADPEPSRNVSREHFQIEHNGAQYVLVDRQSTCGTIVEGQIVGGKHAGGAVPLHDGDVIIVGTSASRYVFKFRLR